MLEFRKEDMIIQPKVHKFTIIFLPGWSRSASADLNIFKAVPLLKDTRIRIIQAPHRKTYLSPNRALPAWYIHEPEILWSVIPGLNEISKLIDEIMQEEYQLCNNIFIGGFSQGGVVAVYTALITSKLPILGIFLLSSLAPPFPYKDERRKIPLFLYYGEKDEILEKGIHTRMLKLARMTLNITYHTDKNLGHTYSWKEFVDLKKWMITCLSNIKL